jgi:hypothetical protein
MKYFKVMKIKRYDDEKSTKDFEVGKIYSSNNDGTGIIDDSNFMWKDTAVDPMLKNDAYFYFEDFGIYMKEVSQFEYEMQRFFNGEISITFPENKDEENDLWREKIWEYLESVDKDIPDRCFDGCGIYYMEGSIINYKYYTDFDDDTCFNDKPIVKISLYMWNEYKSKEKNIENVKTKKSDMFPKLEDNMIVKVRNSEEKYGLGLVIDGKIIFRNGATSINNYTSDLKNKYNKNFDIIETGKRDVDIYSGFEYLLDIDNFNSTWKRLEDIVVGPIFLTENGVDFTINKTTQSEKSEASITLTIGDYEIDMKISDVFSIRNLCGKVIKEYEEI